MDSQTDNASAWPCAAVLVYPSGPKSISRRTLPSCVRTQASPASGNKSGGADPGVHNLIEAREQVRDERSRRLPWAHSET